MCRARVDDHRHDCSGSSWRVQRPRRGARSRGPVPRSAASGGPTRRSDRAGLRESFSAITICGRGALRVAAGVRRRYPAERAAEAGGRNPPSESGRGVSASGCPQPRAARFRRPPLARTPTQLSLFHARDEAIAPVPPSTVGADPNSIFSNARAGARSRRRAGRLEPGRVANLGDTGPRSICHAGRIFSRWSDSRRSDSISPDSHRSRCAGTISNSALRRSRRWSLMSDMAAPHNTGHRATDHPAPPR